MNVVVIETPHQLLNAIEARHSLALGEMHLVIIGSPQFPQSAYEGLIRPEDWHRVHFLSLEAANGAFGRWLLRWVPSPRLRGYFHQFELAALRRKLDALACSFGKVGTAVLGNYWVEHIRHFANVVDSGRICLLDDGTQTLQINQRMKEGQWLGRRRPPWRLRMLNKLIGMQTHYAPSVTFFTIFDLVTRPADRLIKNDYRSLRLMAGAAPPSDDVLFLGSPLSEDGLPMEKYFEYFEKVQRFFGADRLVYVPHHRESPGVVADIGRSFGVELRRFGVPIEYQLTIKRTRPRVLASFCSSALGNCRVIFGDTLSILAFYIRPEEFALNPDLPRDIYAHFERMAGPQFRVVRLNLLGEYA